MNREIVVMPDRAALAAEGARRVAEAVRRSSGSFVLALAGGSTPRDLYRILAGEDLPWDRVHLVWGDERCVPPDHAESNFRMVREQLIDHIPIPAGNVHRIAGESSPREAAAAYARELAALPGIDLALLGLGVEGHTASLFPGSQALADGAADVAAVFVEKVDAWRVTLSPRVLSAAAAAMFVVAGGDKADAVRSVVAGAFDPLRLPAQAVRASRVIWLLDAEAAAELPAGERRSRP